MYTVQCTLYTVHCTASLCTVNSCMVPGPAVTRVGGGPGPRVCSAVQCSALHCTAPGETREGPLLIPPSLVTHLPSSGGQLLGRLSTSSIYWTRITSYNGEWKGVAAAGSEVAVPAGVRSLKAVAAAGTEVVVPAGGAE